MSFTTLSVLPRFIAWTCEFWKSELMEKWNETEMQKEMRFYLLQASHWWYWTDQIIANITVVTFTTLGMWFPLSLIILGYSCLHPCSFGELVWGVPWSPNDPKPSILLLFCYLYCFLSLPYICPSHYQVTWKKAVLTCQNWKYSFSLEYSYFRSIKVGSRRIQCHLSHTKTSSLNLLMVHSMTFVIESADFWLDVFELPMYRTLYHCHRLSWKLHQSEVLFCVESNYGVNLNFPIKLKAYRVGFRF